MAIGTARGSGCRECCSTGALLAIVVECASRMACIPAQCLGFSHYFDPETHDEPSAVKFGGKLHELIVSG